VRGISTGLGSALVVVGVAAMEVESSVGNSVG
jgi:hypothetical protein